MRGPAWSACLALSAARPARRAASAMRPWVMAARAAHRQREPQCPPVSGRGRDLDGLVEHAAGLVWVGLQEPGIGEESQAHGKAPVITSGPGELERSFDVRPGGVGTSAEGDHQAQEAVGSPFLHRLA